MDEDEAKGTKGQCYFFAGLDNTFDELSLPYGSKY